MFGWIDGLMREKEARMTSVLSSASLSDLTDVPGRALWMVLFLWQLHLALSTNHLMLWLALVPHQFSSLSSS